jgi:uncharacterized membrane protein
MTSRPEAAPEAGPPAATELLAHTSRVEAFSDGVMAIAITLLVLEVKLPGGDAPLLHQLLHAWPSYFAYLVSFLTIGIIWLNHHAFFLKIHRIDQRLQWWNLMLLLFVSFLPFPTKVLAEHIESGRWDGNVAAAVYGLAGVLMTIPWVCMWSRLVRRPELFEPGYGAGFARRERGRAWVGVVVYGGCALIALAVAWLALVLYAAVAVFYALTSQGFLAGTDAGAEEER